MLRSEWNFERSRFGCEYSGIFSLCIRSDGGAVIGFPDHTIQIRILATWPFVAANVAHKIPKEGDQDIRGVAGTLQLKC